MIKIGIACMLWLYLGYWIILGIPYFEYAECDMIFHLVKAKYDLNFSGFENYPDFTHCFFRAFPWELHLLGQYILSFIAVPLMMNNTARIIYYASHVPIKLVGLQAELFVVIFGISYLITLPKSRILPLIFLFFCYLSHRMGKYILLGGLIIWCMQQTRYSSYLQPYLNITS